MAPVAPLDLPLIKVRSRECATSSVIRTGDLPLARCANLCAINVRHVSQIFFLCCTYLNILAPQIIRSIYLFSEVLFAVLKT